MNIIQDHKEDYRKRTGFFKKEETRALRDKPYPLSPEDVKKLCDVILKTPKLYKLSDPLNSQLRVRDSALIAMFWMFLKRRVEILGVKMNDISFSEGRLSVAFYVQKKSKRFKVCAKCNKKSSLDSEFCKYCAIPLDDSTIKTFKPSSPVKVIKRKLITNLFVPYITMWYKIRASLGKEGYLFPPLRVLKDEKIYHFDTNAKMSGINLYKIFQRIHPALNAHLFRYAGTKWLLKVTKGDIRTVQRAGDWASPAPIENYAKSLGLTREDEVFEKI